MRPRESRCSCAAPAKFGAFDGAIDAFVVEVPFTTVTNVNFDPARLEAMLRRAAEMKDRARSLYEYCLPIGREHRGGTVRPGELGSRR